MARNNANNMTSCSLRQSEFTADDWLFETLLFPIMRLLLSHATGARCQHGTVKVSRRTTDAHHKVGVSSAHEQKNCEPLLQLWLVGLQRHVHTILAPTLQITLCVDDVILAKVLLGIVQT